MKAVILMDINTLPSEYKELGHLKKSISKYEQDFDLKVIPYDASKQNVKFNQSNSPIVVGKLDMSFENILKATNNLKEYIYSLGNVSKEEYIEINNKIINLENNLNIK